LENRYCERNYDSTDHEVHQSRDDRIVDRLNDRAARLRGGRERRHCNLVMPPFPTGGPMVYII
jgi:hypothetical protein